MEGMDFDQYVIGQLHNRIVLQQPVRMNKFIIANLNDHHPRDFFPPSEQSHDGGVKERYVLTPRRLLHGTVCPDRRGRNGYWKISNCVSINIFGSDGLEGSKRNLSFYEGEQNNGHKTFWKMIEYRLRNHHSCSVLCDHKGRREELVICKVYEDLNEEDLSSQMKQMEID